MKTRSVPRYAKFTQAMVNTTKLLVEETGALIGYTQSDEITLVWNSDSIASQIWFDGRIAKMTSQLGSLTTLHFYREILKLLPEKARQLPSFDARVWQVPNKDEAVNAVLWRELDATKNSTSMAAATYYLPKELHGKTRSQRQELLFQKGINWNDYPASFKRGTYVQRKKSARSFTVDEIALLPAKHAARMNPHLVIERSDVRVVEMPPLAKVINSCDVFFKGGDPMVDSRE